MLPVMLAADQFDTVGGSGCCWEQISGQPVPGEGGIGSGSAAGREGTLKVKG